MKKIISTILSIILGISMLPCRAVLAADKIIVIDTVNVDMQSKTVNVEGIVNGGMGHRTVTLRVAEQDTDFVNPAEDTIQNIAEIQTDISGKFKYSFELNTDRISEGTEVFDIYATYANTGDTCKAEFSAVNSYESVMKDSVILNIGNKNAIVYGERQIIDNEPYIYEGKVYVNAEFLNKTFKTKFSGDVDIDTLEGKHVYIDNGIVLISEKEITANVGLFSRDFGIYVSNDGDDANSGRIESPVKTPERALELSENFRGFDGCRIYIKGGEYNLGHSLEINGKKNITIDAYANEKVTFCASVNLARDDFLKVEDENVLSRVGAAARDKLVYVDLSAYMSKIETAKTLGLKGYYKLYADNRKQQLARYPDVDYTTFSNIDGTSEIAFTDNERAENWNADDAYLIWFNNVYSIWSRPITCADGATTINKKDMLGNKGAAVNILDELTMPGEWYIDVSSKRLYYCPESTCENIELTTGNYNIFDINNSENITIKSIEIGKNNANAVTISDCVNVSLDGAEVHAAGGRGVEITKSKNCGVKNSEIHDVAYSGVFVSGGDIPTLTPGDNYVQNCHIYDYAAESVNTGGVSMEGMGNIARNNVIHDSASQGVFLEPKSNGMIIENNEIYNVVRGLSDAGAIYGINVKEYTGTKILNNYVHDLTKSYNNWGGIHGIYLDNGTSGFIVSNNIVADSLSAGLIGGGRDNTITNNLFIDCSFEKFDTRVKLGEWLRKYKNWAPDIVSEPGYDESKWIQTYPFWKGLLEDSAKEKAYLDTAVTDADGNITYDESKYFDAGSPWNSVIKNNLTIAQKKTFGMNPVDLWWNPQQDDYNLTYEDNLSVMVNMYQKATLSDKITHSGSGAMRYEIIENSNTSVKKLIGENAKPGELYKISAWIYAEKVKNAAKVQISVDKNPGSETNVTEFPYNIEGSGEINLPEGRWTQVYCYWVSNSNDNSAVISFPECSAGDIFYIDDVTAERVLYSEQALPSPNLNDIYSESESKYAPITLDLSETKTVLKIGDCTPIEAYTIRKTQNITEIQHKDDAALKAEKAEIMSAVSDNNDVISVNNGNITAISSGRAKLTVTDTDGNTASVYIICMAEDEGKYCFDGGDRYVTDGDPVYDGETLRPYSAVTSETGIETKDGMVLGFKYYDSGLSKKDSSGSVRFGFKFGNAEKTMLIEDNSIPGLAEIFASGNRWKRSAGWHQLLCVLSDNGNGDLKSEWYHDGTLVYSENGGIEQNVPVYIYSRANKSALPLYVKDMFVVSEGVETGEISTAKSFTIDDFETDSISWTTSKVDLLDSIYEGNRGMATDDVFSWFENLDKRDLRMKENSSLFTVMPEFEKIDFAKMGNTGTINLHEQDIPIIRLANKNTDGTVTFIWGNVSGASSYRIIISKNSDMSETIYKNTLDTNTDTVRLPGPGDYYYTITAINLSKQYGCETVSDTYQLSIESDVSFNHAETVQSDGKRMVSFIFDCSVSPIGKAMLAEKDSDGKLINIVVSEIPSAVDGQITISGECNDGNILECYLWNGIDSMKPFCEKINN